MRSLNAVEQLSGDLMLVRRGVVFGSAFVSMVMTVGLAAGAAHADTVFGSSVIMTNRDCPTNVRSCVEADGPVGARLQPNQFAGGYGVGLSKSAALLGGASGASEVTFGAEALPSVKVASFSGAATRTGVSATAFRAFTYTGDAAIDFALVGQLHFLTSGHALSQFAYDDLAGDGHLFVLLSLIRVSDVTAAVGPGDTGADIVNSSLGFEDCDSGALASTSYSAKGLSAGEFNASLNLSQACGGGAIVLHKGDSFAIQATLQAISNRGGYTDALHTFNVQYDDAHTYVDGTQQSVGAGFLARTVADGAAVPEPATWAMLIVGFFGAGAAVRRRRMAPRAA